MSNAEHLIENAIYAMAHGQIVEEVLDQWPNDVMLQASGFDKWDIIAMAAHVVYSLYDGVFPEFYDIEKSDDCGEYS